MHYCSGCNRHDVQLQWVVVEDNFECEMCDKCIRELRREIDIKRIDSHS